MENEFLSRLKIVELSRFFITQYNYREVEIKNVEGIFIENRSARYPLIRISNKSFNDISAFNEDLATLKRVVKEYEVISKIEQPKCLVIYFEGEVEDIVDDIYSIVIKDNDDIAQSSLLASEFPVITSQFNLNKINDLINRQTVKAGETTLGTNFNEKRIIDMFSTKEINKQIKFTRYFTVAILMVNIVVFYLLNTPGLFEFDFSYYDAFFFQLGQYYRLFTSLFLNDDLIYTLIIALFMYRYNTFIELKIGTKRMMIFYGLGILLIFAAMIFTSNGTVLSGSYPLLCLLGGGYLGIVTLPSERAFFKMNMFNTISLGASIAIFSFWGTANLLMGLYAFLSGVALAYMLNIKEKDIKKEFLAIFALVIVFMVGLKYLPNQTLSRSYQFEKDYFVYQSYKSKEESTKEKAKIDKYYKRLGAIDYDK